MYIHTHTYIWYCYAPPWYCASQALASGSPNNNPIIPTAAEIEALYHRIFKEGIAQAAAA